MEIVKGFRPKDCLSQQDEASRWIDHRIIYAIDKTKVFDGYECKEVDKKLEDLSNELVFLDGFATELNKKFELTKSELELKGKIVLLQQELITTYGFERAKSFGFKFKKFFKLTHKE